MIMGIWQNLLAGYDANPELSRVDAGGLYPLSSTTVSNQSEPLAVISLDGNGRFMESELLPKRNERAGIRRRDFAIPVTQESLNRTREAYPNPIFDQREYVFPSIKNGQQVETKKNGKYRALLREFAESPFSTPSVRAVFRYISDATRDFDADLPQKTKPKTIVLFRVFLPGNPVSDLWTDPGLFQAWHAFYTQKVGKDAQPVLDLLGGRSEPAAAFHPKKIFASCGNAKLVSANDKTNFTFRGRFADAGQAVSVGYEASQKTHQFLRYLIAKNGIVCGEQVIVPFTPRTGPVALPPPPVSDMDVDWEAGEETSTADIMTTLGAHTGLDYAKAIRNALLQGSLQTQWNAHAPAAIAIFEAATTGRLSITYYRELRRADYLERIQQWHDRCKWPFWRKSKTTGHAFVVFGAPSFDRILQAAFGWPKLGKDASYEKTKQRVRAQLLRTVFDDAPVPPDYLGNAIRRVSNPLGIVTNGKFDRNRFLAALATTCALLKHEYHKTKESFDMSIDLSRNDRAYLYGRLLGAADKLEEYALSKKSNNRIVTAAIRFMQTFSMRPFTTWRIIHDTLLPYIQQVKWSFAFREIQAVMDAFEPGAYENDSPLSGLYLAGYYHERARLDALRGTVQKNREESETSENQENTQE